MFENTPGLPFHMFTVEEAQALLDACQDSEFPWNIYYEAVHIDNEADWYMIGGDGDGVAQVTGSLFNGSAEAIAKLFEAASDLARTIIELDKLDNPVERENPHG